MTAPARTTSRAAALATVLGVLFLTFLDTTVVTVVLGDIQSTLGAGVIPLQWVVNAYALVFASLMLFAGSLGDRWGRKRVMVVGIVIFCAGSVMCAVAPSVGWLIAGRAVMGVGAAASEPGTLSVIRQMYPDRRQRAKAVGGWAAVSGLALALGPVVGGLLAAGGDWRAVFWFNLALGVVLLALAVWFVPRSRDPQPGRVDAGGFVLGTVALGGAIFATMAGEQYGFGEPWVVALFVVAGVALVGMLIVELRVTSPIVDLRLLRRPAVGSALLAAFAVYFGVFSIFFFTALYLSLVEGYGGLRMAALFGPMAALIVVGAVASGWWVARAGSRPPLVVGSVVAAAGLVASRFALTDAPEFGAVSAALALAGLGFGIAVVPVTSAVLGGLPAALSGMAAGATNTARQLGAVVGVTVLGAVVSGTMRSGLDETLGASPIFSGIKDSVLSGFMVGGDQAKGIDFANPNPLVAGVVDSVAGTFRSGIHLSLLVSAALILVVGLVVPFAGRGGTGAGPRAAPSLSRR